MIANVTLAQIARVVGGLVAILVIAGWWQPSIIFARQRTIEVEGCYLMSNTTPHLLTAGQEVAMDVRVLETDRDRASRGHIGASAGVTKQNYRTACPVGKRFIVWWDPHFPEVFFWNWWRLTPYLFVLVGVPIALKILIGYRRKNLAAAGMSPQDERR